MSRMTSTVSRVISDISTSIANHADDFIKFSNTNAEQNSVMQKYYKLSEFPNVLSCIDGTYVPNRTP